MKQRLIRSLLTVEIDYYTESFTFNKLVVIGAQPPPPTDALICLMSV